MRCIWSSIDISGQNILYAYKMFLLGKNRIYSLQNVSLHIFFVLLCVSWTFTSYKSNLHCQIIFFPLLFSILDCFFSFPCVLLKDLPENATFERDKTFLPW